MQIWNYTYYYNVDNTGTEDEDSNAVVSSDYGSGVSANGGIDAGHEEEPGSVMGRIHAILTNKSHNIGLGGTVSSNTAASKNDSATNLDADSAMNFVLQRKRIYEAENRTYAWPMRGIGYLYERHGVILAGRHVVSTTTGVRANTRTNTASDNNADHGGNITNTSSNDMKPMHLHSVHIYNTQNKIKNVNCSDIVIWVRVNGPTEIFAGQAQAIHRTVAGNNGTTACHWEFDFDARMPGSYTIDAKLMEWKPSVPRPIQCPVVTTNASIVEPFPVKKSFLGFKMYRPEEMCCEICSRLEGHCKAWATPIAAFPRGAIRSNKARRGCELYFADETSFGIIPTPGASSALSPMIDHLNQTGKAEFDIPVEQHSKKAYGLPHHSPTSHFLGCGWSYWFTLDYPCLSGALDDSVFFTNNIVTLTDTDVESEDNNASWKENEVASAGKDMAITTKDATVVVASPELCPIESESFGKHFGRWVRDPWPTEQECPHPYSRVSDQNKYGNVAVIHGNDNPNCWRRDDLSVYDQTCHEINCELIKPWSKWVSSLHEEQQWYGHWKHDSGCAYSQYTDSELQQCIDRRKLHGFKVEGASIAGMITQYLVQRLENITLYDNSEGDGTKVTISTFGLLHYCNVPDKVRSYFQDQAPNITENEEFLWVSGYFLSSEREIVCTNSRMREYSVWGDELLTPKGYKMINAYDMTAAMTYDTAAQHDGMHIAGPPMRMILTKIFHYLCSG